MCLRRARACCGRAVAPKRKRSARGRRDESEEAERKGKRADGGGTAAGEVVGRRGREAGGLGRGEGMPKEMGKRGKEGGGGGGILASVNCWDGG